MSAHRYVEEIGSAVMLSSKRSAGVAPKVHHREHVTCMPLPSVNPLLSLHQCTFIMLRPRVYIRSNMEASIQREMAAPPGQLIAFKTFNAFRKHFRDTMFCQNFKGCEYLQTSVSVEKPKFYDKVMNILLRVNPRPSHLKETSSSHHSVVLAVLCTRCTNRLPC